MQVSVIVCTRDRAYAITACLNSIAASLQNVAPAFAEILVVDNGSTDATSQTVKTWAESCAFPVRLLHEEKKGLSHARNCGMAAAQGALIIFTDDDCRLDLNHIADALRHDAADEEPVLRGGRVELGNSEDLPLSIKTQATPMRWTRQMRSARHENVADAIVGCNMALRKTLAQKIGWFDPRFGAGSSIPGGEDTDYIYRAYLADVTLEYVPDMVVYHHHGRKTPDEGNKLMRNYAIGTGALFVKYVTKDMDFCRPLLWDAKHALTELRTRKNVCMPHLNYTYKDKFKHHALGMARYIGALLRNPSR